VIILAKKTNLRMTPIMSLSVFAIFALMIPIFAIAKSNNSPQKSFAAPSPTPEADIVDFMEE